MRIQFKKMYLLRIEGFVFQTFDDQKLCSLKFQSLGLFFSDSTKLCGYAFSGDIGHLNHPNCYKIFVPSLQLLNLLVNDTVDPINRIEFGVLRQSETHLFLKHPQVTYL